MTPISTLPHRSDIDSKIPVPQYGDADKPSEISFVGN